MQYKQNNNSKSKKQNPILFVDIFFLSVCVSVSVFLSLSVPLSRICVSDTTQHTHS